MSIATEVRNYADTALAQGKTALSHAGTVVASAITEAPRPAYAALGAADLVAETLTKRVEALPAEAVENVSKAQQTSRVLLNRTQTDAQARIAELRGRVDTSLGTVVALPVIAKSTTEGYLSTAKALYGKLTARGEAKAAELRKDPRVSKVISQVTVAANQVGQAADSVQGSVSPAVKSAFDAVQSVRPGEGKPATRRAPRKSTGSKSTASTSASRQAPATRSAATRSAATKSTAAKRAPRKTTATKSPATASHSTATHSTATHSTATHSTAPSSSTDAPA